MTIILTAWILLIGIVLLSLIKSLRRPKNYPPGPKFLPWIGNTSQLRKEAKRLFGQHNVFDKWCEKYQSPIIGLKLGNELVVVAHSYELVKEIHTNETFDGRPDNFFLRLRTMGSRMGITCTDGDLWSEHRIFSMRQLRQIGYGRDKMEIMIKNESLDLLQYVSETKGNPIWPGSFLAPSVINVIWSLMAGKRINRDDNRLIRLLDLLNKRSKVFDLCGGILTQMPWLRFFAPEATGYNIIRRLNNELHEFFMEAINEHKLNYNEENSDSDLIYAYIKEMKEQENDNNNTFNDQQLTMTILDFFIAGSQTTSNTLDLALMMMVIRPDIQDKIIDEINMNISKNTIASYSNKDLLPYTEAFLMEVQRYFHITPITGPRRALKETTLHGYHIPKNATILIGLKSVLMDQKHWKDPVEFRPDRFLNNNNEILPNNHFIPFGQGRRRCLGDNLARSCLFTFFVGLMQNYKLQLPNKSNIPSTVLLPGITLSPNPYKVHFIKR